MIIIPPLRKSYDGRCVLDTPKLCFERGKVYSILGANGTGKSTFAKICAGVISDDDCSFSAKQRVSYMPQSSYGFNFSVRKNLSLVSSDSAAIDELMQKLQLSHLSGKNASRLSVGEMQRLSLARVLLSSSDLLILDEPTASMDMQSCLTAEALIRSYAADSNSAVILITHSVSQAKRVSDFLLFFSDGHLVESGNTGSVLTSPVNPETKQFLDFFAL